MKDDRRLEKGTGFPDPANSGSQLRSDVSPGLSLPKVQTATVRPTSSCPAPGRQKRTLDVQERTTTARQLKDCGLSTAEIAAQMGVSRRTVQRWLG